MSKITYQEEWFDEVIDEIGPLLEQHWHEIALNKDKIELAPDWERYRALNEMDIVRIFTARTEDEELVGYFIVIVQPHLHYVNDKFAMNDVIYIHPSYRKGTTAAKLIKYVEKTLKDEGVSVLMVNTKVHAPFDPLLERLGFKNTERLYSKYIGE